MTSITSEQVNYLIFRYLEEAGFLHSAYCFGQESFIARTDIKREGVQPGALITLLQKGLHYVSIEMHLNEDGSERKCTRPFSLLETHVCSTDLDDETGTSTSTSNIDYDGYGRLTAGAPMLPSTRGILVSEPAIPVTLAPALNAALNNDYSTTDDYSVAETSTSRKSSTSTTTKPLGTKKKKKPKTPDSMDIDMVDSRSGDERGWNDEDVTFIRDGVRSSIINIACAPADKLVVSSGTEEGWLQLWEREQSGRAFSISREIDLSSSKDITSQQWHPSDQHSLAVASRDGSVRIVESTDGSYKNLPSHHEGPVFAAKWSPSGHYLATGGLDMSVALWDIETSSAKRIYRHHEKPIMDLDWRTDDSLATCSADKTISVYNNWKDQSEPIQVFTGHENEVNSISWDPTRTVLASCSDDTTARLWKTSQSSAIHVLNDHRKEIYSVRWSPVESRTGSSWLATASQDTTVRLWDAESGKCVRTLAKHSDAAYAVSFSPDGDYLATGARDSVVHVWSLREGIVVRSFHGGPGGVFDLMWTRDGRTLIAGSGNDICVFDMMSLS